MQNKSAELAAYLQSLPGFEVVVPLEASYLHMGATLTDAVLQAGVNYAHVVQPRVERVRSRYPEATTASAFLALLRAANLPAQTYEQAHRLVTATADYMSVPRASFDFSIWRYMASPGG